MYRMGTGDCFALKFFAGDQTVFRVMIDGGAWYGPQARLEPYILDLKAYLEDYADVLLVTHEHQDHVLAFAACAHLFTDGKFQVGQVWLGWTEEEHVASGVATSLGGREAAYVVRVLVRRPPAERASGTLCA